MIILQHRDSFKNKSFSFTLYDAILLKSIGATSIHISLPTFSCGLVISRPYHKRCSPFCANVRREVTGKQQLEKVITGQILVTLYQRRKVEHPE